MRAAILTTDPNTGYQVPDAALAPKHDPARKHQLLALLPELSVLNNPKSLHLAAMQRDADPLGSCGTSAAENDHEPLTPSESADCWRARCGAL
ncbi:MAG: hypothetical protein WB697_09345 [Stellaceae bacterium]